jgi:hypothetical protein
VGYWVAGWHRRSVHQTATPVDGKGTGRALGTSGLLWSRRERIVRAHHGLLAPLQFSAGRTGQRMTLRRRDHLVAGRVHHYRDRIRPPLDLLHHGRSRARGRTERAANTPLASPVEAELWVAD